MLTTVIVRKELGLDKEIGIGSTETLSTLPNKDSLKRRTVKPKYRQNVRFWINAPIRVDLLLEIELLALTFATGIEDATTFSDFFCYTSNQTGNTVSLAISAVGLFPGSNFYVSDIAVSFGLYILGCWTLGQTGVYVGSTRRLWVLVSSMIQTVMVLAAATLMNTVEMNLDRPIGPTFWSAIALLAFAGGGQVAMSRGVRVPEISTANASLAMVDFLIDPNICAKHNRSRNRRVSFLFMLAAGGFVGAYVHKNFSSSITLMISGIIKLLVTVAFGFNKSEDGSLAPRSEWMSA